MSASVLPVLVRAEAVTRELPMAPIFYAVIAFSLFLVGLGVLWTFRNTANKVADRHAASQEHH